MKTMAMGLLLLVMPTLAFGAEYTAAELQSMSQGELDLVYLEAEAGPIPDGDSQGSAVMFAGSPLAPVSTIIASLVWQGKIFDTDSGILVNKVFGFKLVKARLSHGRSLLDGRQSVIIDYKGTSLLFGPVRDEIRLVAPGLYLGRAYWRTHLFGPIFAINFILDFNS